MVTTDETNAEFGPEQGLLKVFFVPLNTQAIVKTFSKHVLDAIWLNFWSLSHATFASNLKIYECKTLPTIISLRSSGLKPVEKSKCCSESQITTLSLRQGLMISKQRI